MLSKTFFQATYAKQKLNASNWFALSQMRKVGTNPSCNLRRFYKSCIKLNDGYPFI